MSNKFRLRRWLFGKNRKNVFVKFLAKQSLKNIRHYENEDRNHIRNGEFWLQNTLLNYLKTKKTQLTIFDVGANNGDWALNILKIHPLINTSLFTLSFDEGEVLILDFRKMGNYFPNNVTLGKATSLGVALLILKLRLINLLGGTDAG